MADSLVDGPENEKEIARSEKEAETGANQERWKVWRLWEAKEVPLGLQAFTLLDWIM